MVRHRRPTAIVPRGRVATYSLPLDVIRNENEVVIRASVSGLDPKDIEVTVDDSVVTISGSTESDRAEESNGYVL